MGGHRGLKQAAPLVRTNRRLSRAHHHLTEARTPDPDPAATPDDQPTRTGGCHKHTTT
jgi:hypothetical protein